MHRSQSHPSASLPTPSTLITTDPTQPPSTASCRNGPPRPSTAAVQAILVRQFEAEAASCRDRLDRAKEAIDQSRAAVASVGDELSAIEARIDGVETALRGDITDGISQLESERSVDSYLKRIVEKLICYGRSIRLVIYYIDPETGLHFSPEKKQTKSASTGGCPFKRRTRADSSNPASSNDQLHPVPNRRSQRHSATSSAETCVSTSVGLDKNSSTRSTAGELRAGVSPWSNRRMVPSIDHQRSSRRCGSDTSLRRDSTTWLN